MVESDCSLVIFRTPIGITLQFIRRAALDHNVLEEEVQPIRICAELVNQLITRSGRIQQVLTLSQELLIIATFVQL